MIKLEDISIPRKIVGCDSAVNIEIHGFADASIQAYDVCLYVRVTSESGKNSSRLLVAKSKVAPLKVISLARLDLCASVLLIRLAEKIVPHLNININQRYFWSDSTIVLAWIY